MRYVSVGALPRKRHARHLGPDGQRLNEELMGEQGFTGASSLLYHRHSPSALVAVQAVEIEESCLRPNHPLEPWHLRCAKLAPAGDPVTGRITLAATDSLTLAFIVAEQDSELYRDARGDQLVFVQSGQATIESVFGRLRVAEGDYALIPASTTHRWVLDRRAGPLRALVFEARGHIDLPARYLTARGQLREGAPYSERDFRPAEGPWLVDGTDVAVLVRTRHGWSRQVYERHPFDVVAWDGCVYPYAFAIRDFEPIVGRVHQPPPAHQTFEGPGFVVCSFVPRPFDFGAGAIKVPYHHANVDADEVLFYVAGDFMSRRGAGIEPGSLTLHPAGFVHGPQPGSVEASFDQDRTEELAVMLDVYSPLALSDAARAVADSSYLLSWSEPRS